MIMIGGTARHAGKTSLACKMLYSFTQNEPITAIKVTPEDNPCYAVNPAWGKILLADTANGIYLTEDTTVDPEKDTARLREAGAHHVWWLHCSRASLPEAAGFLKKQLRPGTVSVCESTSLRAVIEPDLFILIHQAGSRQTKSSADMLQNHADLVVEYDSGIFRPDIDYITLIDGIWQLHPETA